MDSDSSDLDLLEEAEEVGLNDEVQSNKWKKLRVKYVIECNFETTADFDEWWDKEGAVGWDG